MVTGKSSEVIGRELDCGWKENRKEDGDVPLQARNVEAEGRNEDFLSLYL